MLEVRELSKRFHTESVLNDLTFQVGEGEIFGLIGKNGAGKTTTMKIMAGLIKPDAGRVWISDVDVFRYPQKRKELLAYMPDFFGVYDNLTVREYMEFYSSICGFSKKEENKRNLELLDLVNLSDKAEQYVDSLSRGMKQRLCLARTMIDRPKVILLDEPSSGLEVRERIQFQHIVRRLKEEGVTVAISSHNLNELSSVCTSIGILNQGRMVLQGSMQEILEIKESGNVIKLEVVAELEKAATLLKAHPLVNNIAIKGNSISITFRENDRKKESELLTYLVQGGVSVSTFTREEGTLESVFLKLTK